MFLRLDREGGEDCSKHDGPERRRRQPTEKFDEKIVCLGSLTKFDSSVHAGRQTR
jgi:hypothetical protein